MSAWKLVEAVPEEAPAKTGHEQQGGRGTSRKSLQTLIILLGQCFNCGNHRRILLCTITYKVCDWLLCYCLQPTAEAVAAGEVRVEAGRRDLDRALNIPTSRQQPTATTSPIWQCSRCKILLATIWCAYIPLLNFLVFAASTFSI
jgi:hypothetical protein